MQAPAGHLNHVICPRQTVITIHILILDSDIDEKERAEEKEEKAISHIYQDVDIN